MSNEIKVPNQHLEAFRNARLEIQQVGISKKGKNQHFGNTYATLDDIIEICEPILLKHDLLTSFTQTYDNVDKDLKEQYQCFYKMKVTHVPTRQFFESELTLYSERKPQQIGSAMTYAKRYLYQNLLLLATNEQTDDDANKAQHSMQNKNVKKINNRDI
tara:strand:+ start:40 stop:516 length:477 start_codon:yes stop_codon:yes gene_type:complete